jgi:alkylation response protein AidB-like acyl-CoA dehydrogenase
MPVVLAPEQRELRDASRRYLEKAASSAEVHRIALDSPPLDREYWAAVAQLGWGAMLVPEQAGGGTVSGHAVADAAIIAEESGRRIAPGPLVATNVVGWALSRPNAGKHDDTLTGILEGSLIAAWALTESVSGWDPSKVQATARPTADGVQIDGVKRFVECAPEADVFLVTVRGPDDELQQYLVPAGTDGVHVTALETLDPTRSMGDVAFRGVAVSTDQRVVTTAREIEQQFNLAVAIQAAETVGIMERVFEMTLDWVQQRLAFGRPIGSYQALKHRLADHRLWFEAAAGLSEGLNDALERDDPEASILASATKAHVGKAAVELVSDAVQMHGGLGVTWDHDLHLYLRRATVNQALYGSPSEHRDRLCRLCGLDD